MEFRLLPRYHAGQELRSLLPTPDAAEHTAQAPSVTLRFINVQM